MVTITESKSPSSRTNPVSRSTVALWPVSLLTPEYPSKNGSRSSSTNSDCAVTNAEPRMNGITWPSTISMRPSNTLPVMLSCFHTSPGCSRPSANKQAIFALVPVPQGERS